MKKLYLIRTIAGLVFFLTCVSSPVSEVYVGLKAGQGFTNIGMSPIDPLYVSYNNGSFLSRIEHRANGNRRGFQGGVFAIFDILGNFSIQTEVLYSVKGSHAGNDEWVFKYVEFPLLVRTEIPFSSSTSLFFLTGAEIGINIFKEYRGIGGIGQPYTYELENVNNLDWGLVVGTGLSHNLGRFVPLFEIRYTHGLSEIYKREYTFNEFEPEIFYLVKNEAKNRQLSIQFGMAYGL